MGLPKGDQVRKFLIYFVLLSSGAINYAFSALQLVPIPNNQWAIDFATPQSCYIPKIKLLDSGLMGADGRLNFELRAVARANNPGAALFKSGIAFLDGNIKLGNAYADLAVSGGRMYQRYLRFKNNGSLSIKAILAQNRLHPRRHYYSGDALNRGIRKALLRAEKVAKAIYTPEKPELRKQLEAIAVSGEDNHPWRPVNAPSAPYPQRDIYVEVKGIKVRSRYILVESSPMEGMPLSSDAKVLIYLHGMDSRLEESLDLIEAIKVKARESSENWAVLAMDLPSSGFASKINPFHISAISELGRPSHLFGFNANSRQKTDLLDFTESFIEEFVNELDKRLPIKGQIEAVVGGSLGGSMALRLGRRFDLWWIPKVVSWSSASIWHGFADGADPFKQLAVRTAWQRAVELTEGPEMRAKFFSEAFDGAVSIGPLMIVPEQPSQWFGKTYPCREEAIRNSKLERYEYYDRNFRLWRWRLAAEQLVYSHQTAPDRTYPRYLDNVKPTLLACGEEDNFAFSNICSATMDVAKKMRQTKGKFVLFKKTGHSIHNERPLALAKKILEFIGP